MSRGPILTLLSKPDCHLCHEMRGVAQSVLAARGGSLVERDVREDPELEQRYALLIPVLLLGDRELARYRISAARLHHLLAQLGPSA